MLLPIFKFRLDVKKILDYPAQLASLPGWSSQICSFSQSNVVQLYLWSLVPATDVKIPCLLKWLKLDTSQNLADKDFYVFVCQEQKPQQVFQQMTQVDRQLLLQQLKSEYRQILIHYFTTDKTLKERIDKFINAVFCANIPVPQIIEIHMEIIEEFSKQLTLEGRSDEALLDYRLTLIDVLAHLCEVYRCSISK